MPNEELRERLMEIEDAWGLDHLKKEAKLARKLVEEVPESVFDEFAREFYDLESNDPMDLETYNLIKETYSNPRKRSRKSKEDKAEVKMVMEALQVGGNIRFNPMYPGPIILPGMRPHKGLGARSSALKSGFKKTKRTQVGGKVAKAKKGHVWVSHPLFQEGGFWAPEYLAYDDQMGGQYGGGWMPDAASDLVDKELQYDLQDGGYYY